MPNSVTQFYCVFPLGIFLNMAIDKIIKKLFRDRKYRPKMTSYGQEDNPRDYINRRGKGEHYSDKGSHKARSLYHKPNHAEHYKKERKK